MTESTVPSGICRLNGLGRLPQHKIQWVLLAANHRHALAGAQLVHRLATQCAVIGKATHGIVHITVACLVGQALGLQAFNHGQHLRHIVCGPGLKRWAFNAKRIGINMHFNNHSIGEL